MEITDVKAESRRTRRYPGGLATAPEDRVLKVAVVDDDESIRFLIQTLLDRDGLAAVTYASGEDLLADFDADTIGCVVLDLHLPCMGGLEVLDNLTRNGIKVPVIVFTAQGSISKAVAALKSGAVDFVEKPFNNRDLMHRIRESLAAEYTRRRLSGASAMAAFKLASLTPREREVMDRVIAGRLNKNIADDLGICVKTVEFHRSKIMQKFGVHSVVELVQLTMATRRAA